MDLSMCGARIRHAAPLRLDATVRVWFDSKHGRFDAGADVLSTRLIVLGAQEEEPAEYESRLRFVNMTADSAAVLASVLRAAATAELRTWVNNLRGEYPSVTPDDSPRRRGFIRCQRVHRRWDIRWTKDPVQPRDGFTIPADTAPAEIRRLCGMWEAMDDDARHLLRCTAGAMTEPAIALEAAERITERNKG